MGLQRRTQYVPCDAPLLDELCIVDSSSTTTAGPLATSQPTQNAPDDGGLSPVRTTVLFLAMSYLTYIWPAALRANISM
jgi:hypothetical protein